MGATSNIPLLQEEEKALGDDDHCLVLADNISLLSDDNSDDDDDFHDHHHHESNSNESQDSAERIVYWESRESLLQEILEHHSSTGSKLRQEVAGIIEMARETNFCRCLNPKSNGCCCCKCLRQRVVTLLCTKGFNATLCTSKWRHTTKFPGGTHEYIEVTASTQSRKKQVTFLIELGFRDEFKMPKACDEYHHLINQLPEIFVGKPDHLNAVVRVVCDAAKRSTAEKRIHMGPWRKRGFMQQKWSASSRSRNQNQNQSSSNEHPLMASSSSTRRVHMPVVNSYLQFSGATAVQVA